MIRTRLRDERGTTMVELVVVVLLTGLVGAMVMSSLSATVKAGTSVQDKTASIADVRTSIEVVERDLRAANPIDAIDPALSVSLYATQMSFSVYCATVGVSGCGSDHLRHVTYRYQSNRLERLEGGVTQLLVGPSGPASLAVTKQRSAVVNSTTQPVFRYFDRKGNELATSGANAPPSSHFRDCVRHVVIHLVINTEAKSGTPPTADITTTGTLRNFNEVSGC